LVAKVNVVKDDISPNRLRQRFCSGAVLYIGVLLQQLRNALGTSHGLLHLLPHLPQGAYGLVKDLQIQKEGNQVCKRQHLLKGQATTKVDDDDRTQRRRKLHRGPEYREIPQHLEHGVAIPVNVMANPEGLHLFTRESFDLSNAGQVIVHRCVQLGQLLLPFPERRSNIAVKGPHGQQDQRHGYQREQHERRVHGKQDRRDAYQSQHANQSVRDGMADQPLEHLRVVDHPGHQLTCLLFLVET